MAGGRAERFGKEKCILKFGEKRLLDVAVESVSWMRKYFVAISKNAPETANYVKKRYPCIKTPGKGYVEDIQFLMEFLKEPFLTVACDLPFVSRRHVEEIMASFKGKSIAGMHNGNYVGINIVARDGEEIYEFDDPLIGINVNTPEDIERAKRFRTLLI